MDGSLNTGMGMKGMGVSFSGFLQEISTYHVFYATVHCTIFSYYYTPLNSQFDIRSNP
jgi:hypothetical protein